MHRAQRLSLSRLISGNSNCNIKFFDNWSEYSAYLIGFIAADGCIVVNENRNSKTLEIKLSYKDIEHLTKIKNILSPNRKIEIKKERHISGKEYKSCALRIGSRYLCNNLISKGIIPRKSKVLCFPKIPSKYLSHFVRGYFDGDGWICFNKNNNNIREIGICSASEKFIAELNRVICANTNVNIREHRYKKDSTFNINYYYKDALEICHWLYKDSTIHLDRKYNKYQRVLEEKRQ